jgi:hypothetical protein
MIQTCPITTSAVCSTESQLDDPAIAGAVQELGVQVAWSSGDVAGARGLDVNYAIGGSTATALIPFGIWLCARVCPEGTGSLLLASPYSAPASTALYHGPVPRPPRPPVSAAR